MDLHGTVVEDHGIPLRPDRRVVLERQAERIDRAGEHRPEDRETLGGCGLLGLRLESLDVKERRTESLPIDPGGDPLADEVDHDQILLDAILLRLPEDEQPGLTLDGFLLLPWKAPPIEDIVMSPERLLEGIDLEIEAEADGRRLRIGHAEDQRLDRDFLPELRDDREGIRARRTLAPVALLHRLWQPERLEDGVVEAGRCRGGVGIGRALARCVALLRNFWLGRGRTACRGDAEGEERHRRQHGEQPAEKSVAPCFAVSTHSGNIPSPRGLRKWGVDRKGRVG